MKLSRYIAHGILFRAFAGLYPLRVLHLRPFRVSARLSIVAGIISALRTCRTLALIGGAAAMAFDLVSRAMDSRRRRYLRRLRCPCAIVKVHSRRDPVGLAALGVSLWMVS